MEYQVENHVQPQYQPPVPVPPIVASLACPSGGAWTVTDNGSLYAWGGATPVRGMNGLAAFAGRHAARLEHPTVTQVAAGKLVVIVDTVNERYVLPQ